MTQKKSNLRLFGITLLMMTAIFCVLYHGFLFGGRLYAYRDVGADTIDQYLPVTEFETEVLRSGQNGTYQTGFGLGRFMGGLWGKYLNPVNLPLLLFHGPKLWVGVLLSAYIKYALICVAALLFFRRLLHQDGAAALCALLWTFSGYAVLWGQHYQFLTAVLAFTVAVYGFQLFLDGSRWSLLAVPCIAYLALTSYYHLYITCYFFLVYGVLTLVFRGQRPGKILEKMIRFVPVLLLAAAMAGFALVPALSGFFRSSRMDQVAGSLEKTPLFYDIYTLGAFAFRLISNNLIHVGDKFVGPTNYYECAILSVSLLFLFSCVYAGFCSFRLRFWGVAALCALLLSMPAVSDLLIFADNSQRWSYLLCFAQVIGIGFVMREIFQNPRAPETRKKLLIAAAVTDLGGVCVYAAAHLVSARTGGWLIDPKTEHTLLVIVLIYHAVLACMVLTRKHWAGILLIAASAELVLANYATVYDRGLVTVQEWNEGIYHDGSEQAAAMLPRDSLYRVNKTYRSYGLNDPLMQGYCGMSVYHSTNSGWLLHLAESYGCEKVGNWTAFDGRDNAANLLLGVRYVITRPEETMDPRYYSLLREEDGCRIYENRYFPGFGYFCTERIPARAAEGLTGDRRLACLADRYYFTEDSAPADRPVPSSGLERRLTRMQENGIRDLHQEGNTFSGTVRTPDGLDGELCIPLIYDGAWRAWVDGREAEVHNINGGLVGIPVPGGTHEIRLTYLDHANRIGWAVSVCGLGICALWLAADRRKKNKQHD